MKKEAEKCFLNYKKLHFHIKVWREWKYFSKMYAMIHWPIQIYISLSFQTSPNNFAS